MKNVIGSVRCYVTALWNLLLYGIWVPHVFESEYEDAIIIATENSFRVSDNYGHRPDERVYTPATLIKSSCIYCGKQELSWMQGRGENVRKLYG